MSVADEIMDRMDMVAKKCDSVHAYLSKLDERLCAVEARCDARFSAVESKTSRLSTDLSDVRGKLNRTRDDLVNYASAFEEDMKATDEALQGLLESMAGKDGQDG